MINYYDKIKADHAKIVNELAQVSRLFGSIPKTNSNIALSTEATSDISKLLPEDPKNSHATKEWSDKNLLLTKCRDFYAVLDHHFKYENEVIFVGVCMAMPRKKIIEWVIERTIEHGEILESTRTLAFLFEVIDIPANQKITNKIKKKFDELHNKIITHALEEDTKLPPLLIQNSDVARCIIKLREEWKS